MSMENCIANIPYNMSFKISGDLYIKLKIAPYEWSEFSPLYYIMRLKDQRIEKVQGNDTTQLDKQFNTLRLWK